VERALVRIRRLQPVPVALAAVISDVHLLVLHELAHYGADGGKADARHTGHDLVHLAWGQVGQRAVEGEGARDDLQRVG